MTLNSILYTATSGLQSNQTALVPLHRDYDSLIGGLGRVIGFG